MVAIIFFQADAYIWLTTAPLSQSAFVHFFHTPLLPSNVWTSFMDGPIYQEVKTIRQ